MKAEKSKQAILPNDIIIVVLHIVTWSQYEACIIYGDHRLGGCDQPLIFFHKKTFLA